MLPPQKAEERESGGAHSANAYQHFGSQRFRSSGRSGYVRSVLGRRAKCNVQNVSCAVFLRRTAQPNNRTNTKNKTKEHTHQPQLTAQQSPTKKRLTYVDSCEA